MRDFVTSKIVFLLQHQAMGSSPFLIDPNSTLRPSEATRSSLSMLPSMYLEILMPRRTMLKGKMLKYNPSSGLIGSEREVQIYK